jgi:hypothetical protein
MLRLGETSIIDIVTIEFDLQMLLEMIMEQENVVLALKLERR